MEDLSEDRTGMSTQNTFDFLYSRTPAYNFPIYEFPHLPSFMLQSYLGLGLSAYEFPHSLINTDYIQVPIFFNVQILTQISDFTPSSNVLLARIVTL